VNCGGHVGAFFIKLVITQGKHLNSDSLVYNSIVNAENAMQSQANFAGRNGLK
jgi:hypothetical protein